MKTPQNQIIHRITLKIGDKEVNVTKEQAQQLYKALHELFGEPAPVVIPQPYPVIRERERIHPHWHRWPDIICKTEPETIRGPVCALNG